MPAIEETAKEKETAKKAVGKTSRRTIDKWKKKKWFVLHASKSFNQREIGETPAEKPELVEGRTILVSAQELVNVPKKQHLMLKFKVDKVQGLKAYTRLVGHEVNPNFIRRLVRRRTSKIESNQVVELKDGKAKVKALTVTARKLFGRQETKIRKIMADKIASAAKKKEFEEFLHELLFGSVLSKINSEAKKIGLLKRIEIIKTAFIESK
ncbi:MAG: hypothetical protein AB1467_04240 [Candidatus Diapherotrites archaeon]